jgi:outer membrane lipoprotein-sorting protein
VRCLSLKLQLIAINIPRGKDNMRRAVSLILICVAALFCGQSKSSKYESALILEVKQHRGPIPDKIQGKIKDPSTAHYDVSIRVKSTQVEYVLLYTPLPGKYGFQFMAGTDLLVLVEKETVTFNDVLGRSIKVPILSQRHARS